MIIWRLIVRDLRRHPGRSTLTLLSIAIGIASVIAVSLATATTRQAYQRMYEEIAGRAALQITAPANATFPQEVAEKIARVPGVQAAVPSYQRATRIIFEHKWLALIAMGIDPVHDSDAREYELREGRFLTPGDNDSGLLESRFRHRGRHPRGRPGEVPLGKGPQSGPFGNRHDRRPAGPSRSRRIQ